MIRERAEVSLEELAAVLGVHRATLSRWERGLLTPRRGGAAERYFEALEELEAALGAGSGGGT